MEAGLSEATEFNRNLLAFVASSSLELTQAYPYFLQEYGRHVWRVAADSPIGVGDVERAHPNAQEDLDEGFFTVRFERASLIDKGLIFSPEYGLVDFTVPHFAGFMQRNFPFQKPEVQP